MHIKLLVLRTSDPRKLADFYSLLGLVFDYHKHGNSPYHYSTTIGTMVLEIYPLAKSQAEADKNLRLGFSVPNFEETLNNLTQNHVAFTEPAMTDFGFLTVISDIDGRKIELYQLVIIE